MKVPIAKPYFDDKEKEAVASVLDSGWVVQGPRVAKFERLVADYTRAKFARATSSCTTALHLALLAAGIKPGDRVMVSAFTYIASANAIEYIGAEPVFVDINQDTFNIDPRMVAATLEKQGKRRTEIKGIMPVHLFGLSANMDLILDIAGKNNLIIIEDAACALGAQYHNKYAGTFGDAGCFSFHPRKSVTTGEGGMIVTDSTEIASRIESLRDHGASLSDLARHEKGGFLLPEFNVLGYNYRMTDLQGAIGVEQMRKLDDIADRKAKRAAIYNEQLAELEHLQIPATPDGCRHIYQSYVTRLSPDLLATTSLERLTNIRNRIMAELEERGVATRQGTSAVHTLGYYRQKYNLKEDDFPAALAAERMSITLPLYPQMTDAEQEYVIDNLIEVTGRCFDKKR